MLFLLALLLLAVIAGMIYLLRIERLRWAPVVIAAGVILVTQLLPYVEFFSDAAVLLLLLLGVIMCMLCLLKIEWIERLSELLLPAVIGIAMVVISFCFPVLFVMAIWWGDYCPELLDRYIPLGGIPKIIELDKFKTFSGKKDGKYYFTVLMRSPPKDTEKLKARMVEYFYKKTREMNAVDPGSYVGDVYFWKYARTTAYFIDNDEDHGGFSTNYLDKYPEARIGYISARNPCGGDTTKYEDVMYMYEKGGKYRETAEGLYSECGGHNADKSYKYGGHKACKYGGHPATDGASPTQPYKCGQYVKVKVKTAFDVDFDFDF